MIVQQGRGRHSPTPNRSGHQQHGRPQQAASTQQASLNAVGLAAKATPGANKAEAAKILVISFMSVLQNQIVMKVDVPAREEAAESAFRRLR